MSAGRQAAGGHTADHPTRGSKNPTNGTIRSTVVVLGATSAVGRGVVRAALEVGPPGGCGGPGPAAARATPASSTAAPMRRVLATTIASDADGARLAAMLRRDGRPLVAVVDAMSRRSGSRPPDRSPDRGAAPHPRRRPAAAPRGSATPDPAARRGEAWRQLRADRRTRQRSAVVRTTASARSRPPALRMLACVLHDEARSLDVRVQMLSSTRRCAARHRVAHQCPEWPSGRRYRTTRAATDRSRPPRRARAPGRALCTPRRAQRQRRRIRDRGNDYQTGTSLPDVRSFLKTLISYDRNEVYRR